MPMNKNTEHRDHGLRAKVSDFQSRLSFVLTPPDRRAPTWGVIRCEKARTAFEDIIAPIVFQLGKLLQREFGAGYGAELEISGSCFDDECLEATIALSGPKQRAAFIEVMASSDDAKSEFSFDGNHSSIELLYFEPDGDGYAISYQLQAKFLRGYVADDANGIVKIDAKCDFLAFLANEVSKFVAKKTEG